MEIFQADAYLLLLLAMLIVLVLLQSWNNIYSLPSRTSDIDKLIIKMYFWAWLGLCACIISNKDPNSSITLKLIHQKKSLLPTPPTPQVSEFLSKQHKVNETFVRAEVVIMMRSLSRPASLLRCFQKSFAEIPNNISGSGQWRERKLAIRARLQL